MSSLVPLQLAGRQLEERNQEPQISCQEIKQLSLVAVTKVDKQDLRWPEWILVDSWVYIWAKNKSRIRIKKLYCHMHPTMAVWEQRAGGQTETLNIYIYIYIRDRFTDPVVISLVVYIFCTLVSFPSPAFYSPEVWTLWAVFISLTEIRLICSFLLNSISYENKGMFWQRESEQGVTMTWTTDPHWRDAQAVTGWA